MKLTLKQAAQIREEAKKFGGEKTIRQLQEEYKVSYETIRAVLDGREAYKIFSEDPERAKQLVQATKCIYDKSQPKKQRSQDTTRTQNITMEYFYGKDLMTNSSDIEVYLEEIIRKCFHIEINAYETEGISTVCLCSLLYAGIRADILGWQKLKEGDLTIEEAKEPIVIKLSNSSKRTIGLCLAQFFDNIKTVSKSSDKFYGERANFLLLLIIKRWVRSFAQEGPNIPMLRQSYNYLGTLRSIKKCRGTCVYTNKKTAIYNKVFINKELVPKFQEIIRNTPSFAEYEMSNMLFLRYQPK